MNEYLQAVNLYYVNNIDLRYGQALFNKLVEMHPEVAEIVRGTTLDPFYWDKADVITKDFLVWVGKHLD